jgi:hypothetical protein
MGAAPMTDPDGPIADLCRVVLSDREQQWRLLWHTVTHLQRWANDLPRLREEVDRFLSGFAGSSTDLLRYLAYLPDYKDHKPSLSAWKPLRGWRFSYPCHMPGEAGLIQPAGLARP